MRWLCQFGIHRWHKVFVCHAWNGDAYVTVCWYCGLRDHDR